MRLAARCVLLLCMLALAPAGRGDATEPSEHLGDLESRVLAAVNGHRISIGEAPLVSDATLTDMALAHSEDMAAGRVGFGHEGFRQRRDAVARLGPFERVAENVSRHRRDLETIPAAALESWIASPSHRKNLEGDYQHTGVAAARADDGIVYITQLFLRRR